MAKENPIRHSERNQKFRRENVGKLREYEWKRMSESCRSKSDYKRLLAMSATSCDCPAPSALSKEMRTLIERQVTGTFLKKDGLETLMWVLHQAELLDKKAKP